MSSLGHMRSGAAMQTGARRRAGGGGGGVPVNLSPPSWDLGAFLIGEAGAVTQGSWTGSPSLSYALLRDGVVVEGPGSTWEDIETYVIVAADIGPTLVLRETDSVSGTHADSPGYVYDDATHLPLTAIGVSTAGLTTADSGTTVDAWAATLGGLACTLTAPAALNRPAFSASGGVGSRPLVTFDGLQASADVLWGIATRGAAWADYEIGVVGKRLVFGVLGDVWIAYDQGGFIRFSIEDQDAARFRFSVPGASNPAHTPDDPDVAPLHLSGDASGSTINTRVGGVVGTTATAAVPSRTDGGAIALGARINGSIGTNIAVQAWHAGPALTTTQRTHLRALLTYHTGVAC